MRRRYWLRFLVSGTLKATGFVSVAFNIPIIDFTESNGVGCFLRYGLRHSGGTHTEKTAGSKGYIQLYIHGNTMLVYRYKRV